MLQKSIRKVNCFLSSYQIKKKIDLLSFQNTHIYIVIFKIFLMKRIKRIGKGIIGDVLYLYDFFFKLGLDCKSFVVKQRNQEKRLIYLDYTQI